MEEQNNKRRWLHPITKKQVTVEIDSPEDKAFVEKLTNSGLGKLEEDKTPLSDEWWKKHRQEMLDRFKNKLKEEQDGTTE